MVCVVGFFTWGKSHNHIVQLTVMFDIFGCVDCEFTMAIGTMPQQCYAINFPSYTLLQNCHS